MKERADDRAHPRLSAPPPRTRGWTMVPASSSISTSCATTIGAFAKALPDSRVFYAVKANPAPELLSLLVSLGSCFDTASVAEIEMVLAAGATRRAHLLRQHHQEGARHRARLCARRPPVRGRLQGRGGEDRPRRARRQGLLPLPVRLRRRGMAAVAEVRLRSGDGGRRARPCAQARARAGRRVVSCRLAAAPHRGLGRGA